LTSVLTPVQTLAQLEAASAHLRAGRPAQARTLLEQIVRAAPRSSDAFYLLSVSLGALGEPAAAEAPIRQAIAIDKRKPDYHLTLGDVLRDLGRNDQAEKSYRAALALNRRHGAAVRQLTGLLTEMGRADEALRVIAPLVGSGAETDFGLLTAHARALKALGRLDDALVAYQKALVISPSSGVAEHNVASVLGDLGRNAEAEAAARRAITKGIDAPETWLVQARALCGLGRYDEAEVAFRTALRRRPLYLDAHRDLAQLIWMRTEDKTQAVSVLDAALRNSPDAGALRQLKAKVLNFAGDAGGADAALSEAITRHPNDASLLMSAAQAALKCGDARRGLAYAENARALSPPGDLNAAGFVCEALLVCGQADAAAALAADILNRAPEDQQALAYQATAWRLLDDERYQALYDFDAFVQTYTIDTPKGWSSLNAYLADLAASLYARHSMKTHPLDQSLRQGSQLSNVLQSDDPAIKAFPAAVDGPIRAYMSALGRGKDPFRRRGSGDYRLQGAWSVKLRPGGGRHVDHLHPEGWISSACYVDLPKAVAEEGRQGWIRFGEPGMATTPPLEAELYVRPKPGLLVLFPSYMWHGTVPFGGDQSRLTMAFDVLPLKR
jgi:tetratricopeptide (TPR) repeat protein